MLLALLVAASAPTCCWTVPWSYILCSSSWSILSPMDAFYRDRLLAVSTSANSQYALPASAAGVCHAKVTLGASFDRKATHSLSMPFAAGGVEKSANPSLFSWSSPMGSLCAARGGGRRGSGCNGQGQDGVVPAGDAQISRTRPGTHPLSVLPCANSTSRPPRRPRRTCTTPSQSSSLTLAAGYS
ncbi:hypothetical protein E2562_009731 [Oryza meyeriana var. granulata]|uniref:Secreted protein n=1 Tax=Oryza meyeriana var. granulata TaxID=110450 RepID=A0A6G1D1T3_9ORYZ|nr:hypothetical protein E2562_009731 [Oryza meyeriana var. granulata]